MLEDGGGGEGGEAAKGRGGTTRVAAPEPPPPFSLLLDPHPPRPAQVRRARPRRLHAARRHDPHDEPARRLVDRERGAHPDGARRVSQHLCSRAVGRRARACARARARAGLRPRRARLRPSSPPRIDWARPRGACERRSSAGARMARSFGSHCDGPHPFSTLSFHHYLSGALCPAFSHPCPIKCAIH